MGKKFIKGLSLSIILWSVSCSFSYAQDVLAKENEQLSLKERIVKLEIKVDEGFKSVNQRIDNLEKTLNQRIDDLRGLIYVILAGIIGLIGFIMWDRRTTIAPVTHELKEVVKQAKVIIDVLKRYAQEEPKMAQAIKYAGLL